MLFLDIVRYACEKSNGNTLNIKQNPDRILRTDLGLSRRMCRYKILNPNVFCVKRHSDLVICFFCQALAAGLSYLGEGHG